MSVKESHRRLNRNSRHIVAEIQAAQEARREECAAVIMDLEDLDTFEWPQLDNLDHNPFEYDDDEAIVEAIIHQLAQEQRLRTHHNLPLAA